MRQEAHQSIPILKRWSTLGRHLQPSLGASSAVRPRLISRTSYSPSPGTRLAATRARTTQLALMQSAPSTILCSGSACCSKLLHAYRRMQPPDAAIREAYRPGSRAAPAQAVGPASLTLAVHTPRQLPATPGVGPLSSESIVPMLRRLRRCLTPAQTVLVCLWCPTSRAGDIHCIDTAAVAAPRRRPVYSTQHSN